MEKQQFIFSLNRILANYFVLKIKLYRYRWFIQGPEAGPLKRLLVECQKNIEQDIEHLANLILIVDGKPFATMVKFIKEATIPEATADDELDEITEQLLSDLTTIEKKLNEEAIAYAFKEQDFYSLHILLQLLHTLKQCIFEIKLHANQI